MTRFRFLFIFVSGLIAFNFVPAATPTGKSVVFIHPDGSGLPAWNIYRIWRFGPDGYSQWDLLPGVAVYRAHMRDHLNASSHGGGTIHAYGVKVPRDSFGMFGKEPLLSASGYDGSLMNEAMDAGMTVGIINSGHLAEPGTAAMLASVPSRKMSEEIVLQLVESGAPLMLGGGEILFLPDGVMGKHGKAGVRTDGRNLVQEAEAKGYTVIYTLQELLTLSADTEKVLGLFAAEDTYNDENEETLGQESLPTYETLAPTVAQMTEAALKWMSAKPAPFFLMVEEEGTDNFTNAMNAYGMLDAHSRADDAIGVARTYVAAKPGLSLIVTCDSEASGPELIDYGVWSENNPAAFTPLPATLKTGAMLDGSEGTETVPFISAPDNYGQRHLFGVAWTDGSDKFGAVLVRAEGPLARKLPANVDNTEVYKLIRAEILED